VIISLITLGSIQWSERFGFTGISMLYLLLVVGVAYHLSTELSVLVGICSFLILNYFFVEPKFTFQVAHVASWVSLISFLIVSIVISSLVKRLKIETIKSNEAFLRADLLRQLAEKLSFAEQSSELLVLSQEWLKSLLCDNIFIIKDMHLVKGDFTLSAEQVNAISWVQANGKVLGAGTENWPNADYWIAPFNRLSSDDPVVFIPQLNSSVTSHTLESIKLAISQISTAYLNLLQKEKMQLVEHQAQEESIKSTLLASIAHDMRTPLTSILGAASTLNQADISLDKIEMRHLTNIINSQAKHLARTTENILSLVRLASVSKETIAMTLLSPDEIIASIIDLYQHSSKVPFVVRSKHSDLLIYANHDLIVLALTNLIENAIQANDENKTSSSPIKIDVEQLDNKIMITVSDNGKGFSEGFKESMIKTFSSTRNKGFGLGLPIVLAIAKLHDASLCFNNEQSQGAKVSLVFNKPEINLNHVG
jgi:two-component system, OmpR family, sensor histidine kinase KdpD